MSVAMVPEHACDHRTATHLFPQTTLAIGEDSYSHHNDGDIGAPIINRFTFHLARFLEAPAPASNATPQDLADYLRCWPLI